MKDFFWTGQTTRKVVRQKLASAIKQMNNLFVFLKRMQDVGYCEHPEIEEGIEISIALAYQLSEVLHTIREKI